MKLLKENYSFGIIVDNLCEAMVEYVDWFKSHEPDTTREAVRDEIDGLIEDILSDAFGPEDID